jgi:hypothetical protein
MQKVLTSRTWQLFEKKSANADVGFIDHAHLSNLPVVAKH